MPTLTEARMVPPPFVFPPLSGQTRTLGQSWLQAPGWGCPSLQRRFFLPGEELCLRP